MQMGFYYVLLRPRTLDCPRVSLYRMSHLVPATIPYRVYHRKYFKVFRTIYMGKYLCQKTGVKVKFVFEPGFDFEFAEVSVIKLINY